MKRKNQGNIEREIEEAREKFTNNGIFLGLVATPITAYLGYKLGENFGDIAGLYLGITVPWKLFSLTYNQYEKNRLKGGKD